MKLFLDYSEVLNGKFAPGSVNLMMVFQVNCPGCFTHGFPLMMDLQQHFGNALSCYTMATAFEDFELNTYENAKQLASDGLLVGETLKAQNAGMFTWNYRNISLPILLDNVVDQSQLTNQSFIEGIVQNVLSQNNKGHDRETISASLQNYFSQQPKCGKTFAANLMRGTPSFYLFTKEMDVLVQWFGHAEGEAVKRELSKFIGKKHG